MAGVGTDHILRAVINGLVGEWMLIVFSYKEPIVSEVSGPGALDSTEGGATVNIYGSNFGPRFANRAYMWYHNNANLYPTGIYC